jgi:hypothetical protein
MRSMSLAILALAALCLSPIPSFGKDEKGTDAAKATPTVVVPPLCLAEKKGEVTIYSRNAKGQVEKRKASPPEALDRFDRIVTGKKAKAFLQFREGGTVEVGPESDVMVAELEEGTDFKARFLLTLGKVKAAVRKLTTATSKFEVEAGGVVAGVRGTHFEVDHDPEKKQVTAKTYEGEIYAKRGGKTETLKKGLTLSFGDGGDFVAGALGVSDLKDFGEFLTTAGGLEKRKELLFKQLEKQLLKKLTGDILGKGKDGKRAIKFGF